MKIRRLHTLLKDVRSGRCSIPAAAEHLAQWPFADLGFAKIDHHRALRCGMGEVVFGMGKTVEQTLAIVEQALAGAPVVLATRLSGEQAQALCRRFKGAHYNALARIVRVGPRPAPVRAATVCILTAGTSDMPVAEEARETIEAFGGRTETLYDVGVAGLHRLLKRLEVLRRAKVVVAVAGMEGALPSVAGGLVSCPVIAVPTSIGYGASYNGLAALLAMLNSCASGVSVVNIDNGFGAGAAALRMLGIRVPEKRPRRKGKRKT